MFSKIKTFWSDFITLMAKAQTLEINAYQINSKSSQANS